MKEDNSEKPANPAMDLLINLPKRMLQARQELVVGSPVKILESGGIGEVTSLGCKICTGGQFCFVRRPDGVEERFIFPEQVVLI